MKIRQAKLTDAAGIAKVHVDSWRTTYNQMIPAAYLNRLSYKSREELWKGNLSTQSVYVAENDQGEIVGFSGGGKERTGNYPAYKGEIYAIYILKEYQQKGLGKLLLKPVVSELLNLSFDSLLVLVLEANPSRHFYEALGAKKIEEVKIKIENKVIVEGVYGWGNINDIARKFL
ncbi:GNAT family N-acetyltransferase [Cytobacillus purgationiresistens]|uniref:GNAT superfamily N-acetyltransferase n=1 Tax=Cytobacillus purgationiresistens TaxID=863449 RepID=A0ABU0AA94_9BACI|nr:GNAT family N-acetyltransferase [Cytobacillus purgationiresistens]MDQ0268171.1 GNAT superfamily N-acetyltransferase [Cytobacillus purgationiresistens]